MTSTTTADVAVRDYLLFVEDPARLVDHNAVEKFEARMASATDPLERLIAIADHERAIHPDEDSYRAAFIAHAKKWAADHNVTAVAFEKMGVSPEVLSQAGLAPIRRGALGPGVAKERSGSVSVIQVKSAVQQVRGTFHLSEIAIAAGGSPMTIRKAVSELIDEGRVRRIGPDPQWSGKGRAPILYEHA